jgi:Winged helix-turn helix
MARGRKSPFIVSLAPHERTQLERWQRATTIKAGLAKRAKIILLRAEGQSLSAIARRLEIGRRIVRKWVIRFLQQRLAGLLDKLGRGRKPVFSPRGGDTSGQDGLRAA